MPIGILFDWIFAMFWKILFAHALVRVCRFFYLLYGVLRIHLTPSLDLSSIKDTWAVATGCTDGIGKAYVEEMARLAIVRKFVLIGRSLEKLGKLADKLRKNHGCQVMIIVADFAVDSLDAIAPQLEQLDIGFLLNCAGTGPNIVADFARQPKGQSMKIINVNLATPVKIMEMVLPKMLAKNCGFVVNIGSATGWRPLPYISSYPASKAALSFFSSTLSEELHYSNVKIQCLLPVLVATKIAAYDETDANCFVLTPTQYARSAVTRIGLYPLGGGCLAHDLQLVGVSLIPFWLFKWFFVNFVLLKLHKHRLEQFVNKTKNE